MAVGNYRATVTTRSGLLHERLLDGPLPRQRSLMVSITGRRAARSKSVIAVLLGWAKARAARQTTGRVHHVRYQRSRWTASSTGRRSRQPWRSKSGTSRKWDTGPTQSHAMGRTWSGTPTSSRRNLSR